MDLQQKQDCIGIMGQQRHNQIWAPAIQLWHQKSLYNKQNNANNHTVNIETTDIFQQIDNKISA